jgi:hypothetical protein
MVVVLCVVSGCGTSNHSSGGVSTPPPPPPPTSIGQIPSAIDEASFQKIIDEATLDTSNASASKPTYPEQGAPATYEFIKIVINDVGHYWSQVFAKGGINYRLPS